MLVTVIFIPHSSVVTFCFDFVSTDFYYKNTREIKVFRVQMVCCVVKVWLY